MRKVARARRSLCQGSILASHPPEKASCTPAANVHVLEKEPRPGAESGEEVKHMFSSLWILANKTKNQSTRRHGPRDWMPSPVELDITSEPEARCS